MVNQTSRSRSWRSENTTALFRAILSLKDLDEIEIFFRDLCTIPEIREFALRWKIARMLAGGMSYRDVAHALKVSTTTVARVAHWLDYGKGGYRTLLARMGINPKRKSKNK